MIRILIVDDSPTARQMLTTLLSSQPDMEVAGVAGNGAEALRKAAELRPDIITLDLVMPVMSGFEALPRLREEVEAAVLVVSGGLREGDEVIPFQAFECGAASVLPKPAIISDPYAAALVAEIRAVVRNRAGAHGASHAPRKARKVVSKGISVVGIAASTGGPQAIQSLLKEMGPGFPAPIMAVQHIAEGFVSGLARWLSQTVGLPVVVAARGELAKPGVVYLAPDNAHILVGKGLRISISHAPPVGRHRPSATPLFLSMARVDPRHSVGVILTGMGEDGVEGLRVLHEKGGLVMAQSPEDCVVSSMPATAIKVGAVDCVGPPVELGSRLRGLGGAVGKVWRLKGDRNTMKA